MAAPPPPPAARKFFPPGASPPPVPSSLAGRPSIGEPPAASLPPPPPPPAAAPVAAAGTQPPKPLPPVPRPMPPVPPQHEDTASPTNHSHAPPIPTSSRPAPPRPPPSPGAALAAAAASNAGSPSAPPPRPMPPVPPQTTSPPALDASVSPSSAGSLGTIPEASTPALPSVVSASIAVAQLTTPRSSFVGPPPGSLGAKRAGHRPSISMGFNGMAVPIKKVESTTDMMASLVNLPPEEVAEAFLNSEGDYIAGLKIALDVFCMRLRNHIALKRELLNEMEVTQLFANIANIRNFNTTLYHDLASLYDQSPKTLLENLGHTMVRFIPFFKLYTDYVKNYRENVRQLMAKRAASKDLEFFVQLNEMSTGRSFQALLSSPANRLAQYLVFLGDIYKKIDKSAEWAEDYEQAVRRIQTVTDDIALHLKDQKARALVVYIQVTVFDNTIDVLSPSRMIAKYGKLRLITDNLIGSGHSTEKVMLVLANDMLFYGERSGKLSKGRCKAAMQLPGMFAEDLADNQAASKAYADVDIARCFRIKTRVHKPIIFQAADVAQKNLWLACLTETIDRYSSVMKRSVAPDQLQLACMSAEDFERAVMKKKVDSKAMAAAVLQAQTMAAANKANPLPPSPTGSPAAQTRSLSQTAAPTGQRSSFSAPPPLPDGAGRRLSASAPVPPPLAPTAPPMAPPMAPPIAPSIGAPAAPPMRSGPPPPPGPPGPPALPTAPGAPRSPPAAPTRNDLLSSIREAGITTLKKASLSPPLSPPPAAAAPSSPAGGGGLDLNAALKSSLDRYRQFVQDEDENDNDEWDD